MEYISLYRRYRPRRFNEITGQSHVVAALSNAVRDDRVFHAYLLSGPRGTGKTTIARILAKALNCEALVDGEPCCECNSCCSIEGGNSFDLHELDAASNNKVDDIRELLAKVSLGTPGKTKVYLLDEVHMLTSGAENALLKTLEEPPDHVIFVMATTEPHKVVETIRSRTQHLEFDLLSTDQLESLLEKIVIDADLDVDSDGLRYAVRSARGSARDALSILDRVVAAGVVRDDTTVPELLDAIAEKDISKALSVLSTTIEQGREPRVVGEAFLSALREAFLIAMGVPSSQLIDADQEMLNNFVDRVTPAIITRSLETLGSTLVEMRRSPDPRIDLEVALVRMTTKTSSKEVFEVLESLVQRVEKLEQSSLKIQSEVSVSNPPPSLPSRSSKDVPISKSEVQDTSQDDEASAMSSTALSSSPSDEIKTADLDSPSISQENSFRNSPSQDDLTLVWGDDLLPSMSKKVRARFAAGRFIDVKDGVAIFGLPNEPHLRRCQELITEVEAVISEKFDSVLSIKLVVDDHTTTQTAPPKPVIPKSPEDELLDTQNLTNADKNAGSVVEKLTEAFPGAQLVDSE